MEDEDLIDDDYPDEDYYPDDYEEDGYYDDEDDSYVVCQICGDGESGC